MLIKVSSIAESERDSAEEADLRSFMLMMKIMEETSDFLDQVDIAYQQGKMTDTELANQLHAIVSKVAKLKQRSLAYAGEQQDRISHFPVLEKLNNVLNRLDIQLLAYKDALLGQHSLH